VVVHRTPKTRDVAPRAIAAIREEAIPLRDTGADHDALLQRIGEARFVLLGEATHGTHEFYAERARITRRLIEEKGFRAVAVEGDWPDCYRVNRWVRGGRGDANAALGDFRRFPTWMWRNTEVRDFVTWLRGWNDAREPARRAGFYGLDLYSLYASIEVVLRYLDQIDPAAARRARDRYACFARYGEDAQAYAYAATFGASPSCEEEVLRQLAEMHQRSSEFVLRDGRLDPDDHFHAAQNARLVKNAEEYYRSMYRGNVLSWNLRDRHMIETLESLAAHLDTTGPAPARVAVWAHNSHVGDARATEMGDRGEWNIGQLARERFGKDAYLVGFTTHHGTVTAAQDWDEPPQRRTVRRALEGSYEALFHAVDLPRFLLFPRHDVEPPVPLEPLLERAIGVVYRPETERQSHYFVTRMARQFDAVLHFDETRALEPLERTAGWDAGEPPDTYPSGM
jgi:erythromycin esterase-like protein